MITHDCDRSLQNQFNKHVFKMAHFVQESLCKSFILLRNPDRLNAKQIIENDVLIDELELEINAYCIGMIAQDNCKSKDLRYIISVMQTIAELEKIADLVVDIVRYAQKFTVKLGTMPDALNSLFITTQNMMWNAVLAFLKRDTDLSKQIILQYQEADRSYNLVKLDLLNDCEWDNKLMITSSVPLFMIIKCMHLICGHASNITENILDNR